MKELKQIFDRLGMNSQNGLYLTAENNWKGFLPARVEWLFRDKLKPQAFFCIDNKPIVLFFDSPPQKEELFKSIWNFNESPVVIINEPSSVEIFNGLSYLKKEKTLEKLEDENHLNYFSYFELVTGKTWQYYERNLRYGNRVDYYLLENIKDARDLLINKYDIGSSLANALIGKCIFIRYLIDRHVRIKFDSPLREWSNDDFCNLLQNKKKTIRFLNYLKDQFNGGGFLLNDSHLQKIPQEAFNVLSRLMRGTEIVSGQTSLFDIYDFSIIPVEFISNVYEHFIGGENQKKKGAYYTPVFLVDYIISETVEKYFSNNPEEYNCRVLDPACGSGIFLVQALRRMIERYQKINKITSTKTRKFKEILKKIAEENIYGIDQDENAINVAVFSVYLALLDYQEPKEIENFKFPNLFKSNFFTSDFFDLNAEFNNIFKEINFNFIIGNPPWKRSSGEKSLFSQYIDKRKIKESSFIDIKPQITISNDEIAQAFLLRTSDFSNVQTKCTLIVTSKTLYNLNAKNFRAYFLYNYYINQVFELAPVRREVFDRSNDPAITPAAILFFHYANGEPTDKNVIEHIALKPSRFFSLFKIFMLQKNDFKQVIQGRLMCYDWLWKTLVYGSYLDFNLIKRLETDYKTIGDIIYNRNNFLVKQGLKRKDGEKKINVEELIGWDFLDINKKNQIEPFFIYPKLDKWPDTAKEVGYIYRENGKIVKDVFTPPVLLLKETVNTELKSIPVISKRRQILFTDKVTSIKAIQNQGLKIYYEIAGLLYASLFSYFLLLKSSTVGIMIEQQVHDKEKFDFPFTNNYKISEIAKKIESNVEQFHKENQKILPINIERLSNERERLTDDLNNEILESFNLNEQEKTIVDYAINITIPLIMKHTDYEKELFSPLKLKDPFLTEYANVFLNRFKSSFERGNKKFTIKILLNNYIIGMFFKVTGGKNEKELISWECKTENDLIAKLLSLGCRKITERLFIQKDINGFEKDGFYIIKPNEKKLWHQAIAYLDAEEFSDAMLRGGNKEKQNE
jgi:N-6 DNA Methylase